MGRYAILQGVGYQNRPTFTDAFSNIQDWPEMWRKWPHLVIQGPSGQLAILPPPSGAGSVAGGNGVANTQKGCSASYYQYLNLICHKSIAFKHNHIIHWWKRVLNTAETDPAWKWHPYENDFWLNSTGPAFDTNFDYDKHVIFDGKHNSLHMFGSNSIEVGCGGLPLQDGILWAKTDSITSAVYKHGNWTGQLPYVVQTSPTKHYFPGKRMYGNPGDTDSKFFLPDGRTTGVGEGIQGGIDYRFASTSNPFDQTQGICDIIEHQGSIYYCSQQAVWANRLGMKGSFIYSAYFHNRQDEWGGDNTFGLANVDVTRGSQAEFNDPQMRVFAKHKGALFMLQNDGKIFTVDPHAITKIADLRTLSDSPFGSGILGGSLQKTPLSSAGTFPQPRAFRPFMISFNNQLHAFLTYRMTNSVFQTRTGTPVAKSSFSSSAEGIAWFTSHDGVNWHDRTHNLGNASQSGIITPSGNKVQSAIWNNSTAPFIHSAYQHVNYPSGYGPRSGVAQEVNPITGNKAPIYRGTDKVSVLKPSGYRQATGEPKETSSRHENDVDSGKAHMSGDCDRLPIWSSGSMIDAPGTRFNQLKIKLDKGTVSGFLYPTIVNYPSGYDYINPNQLDGVTVPRNLLPKASGGVWGPYGQGAKGWDFTGVRGRHVAGYINESDEKTNNHELMLCFSDNPPNSTTQSPVASHFFALNKSSGWRQVNYVHWGGAFCGGYQPVDLYDPEVIIPSGSIDDPNPHIDIDRGWLRIKFRVLDWGFWDLVKMKFHYTTDDGINWHDGTIASGLLSPLSTSTKQTDPSGLIGGSHEIWWNYRKDIGSQYSPLTRIRLRAEK